MFSYVRSLEVYSLKFRSLHHSVEDVRMVE